jgi:hypothetical protein
MSAHSQPGKTAEVVAVPGNVLSDIHATEHPVFVMHLGRVLVLKTGTQAPRALD